MLGKLLMKSLNLLLLDEPSNHLDIESCDSFIAALDNFQGGVVIVTHNEMFLHSIANRLIVFKDNRVSVFEGTYQEFLEKEGWEDEEVRVPRKKERSKGLNKKEMRRKKSELIKEKSRKTGPLKKKIDLLETKIDENDQSIDNLNQQLLEASQTQDGNRIRVLSKQLADLQSQTDEMFEDLEVHMNEFEGLEMTYNQQIDQFEKE